MNSSTYIVYCLPSRHADIVQTHIQIYLLTSSSFCSAIFKLSLTDLANLCTFVADNLIQYLTAQWSIEGAQETGPLWTQFFFHFHAIFGN